MTKVICFKAVRSLKYAWLRVFACECRNTHECCGNWVTFCCTLTHKSRWAPWAIVSRPSVRELISTKIHSMWHNFSWVSFKCAQTCRSCTLWGIGLGHSRRALCQSHSAPCNILHLLFGKFRWLSESVTNTWAELCDSRRTRVHSAQRLLKWASGLSKFKSFPCFTTWLQVKQLSCKKSALKA